MGTFLVTAVSAAGALCVISALVLVLVVLQPDYGQHVRPTPVRQRVLAPLGTMMLADVPDREAVDWEAIGAADAKAEEEWSAVIAAHSSWLRDSRERRETRQLPVAA